MTPYVFNNHMNSGLSYSEFLQQKLESNKNSKVHKLYEAQKKDELTREEKDAIAEVCYGLFGAQSSECLLGGVAYPFSQSKHCRRVLVRFDHSREFFPYYAPDKTSLRKTLSGTIAEMIYA